MIIFHLRPNEMYVESLTIFPFKNSFSTTFIYERHEINHQQYLDTICLLISV